MEALSVRDFRSNMSKVWDRAKSGENIYVRRGNDMFAIVPIETEHIIVSPELQAKIEQARIDFKEGRCISFDSAEARNKWLDEL